MRVFVQQTLEPPVQTEAGAREDAPPKLEAVYAAHGDFVWLSLQRLGVRTADLDDMLQEVFAVVHQRLHTYDRRASMKAWLFGIAIRVAAAHRRRAHVRREQPTDEVPEPRDGGDSVTPEEAAAASEARARLNAILDAMDLEKRAVFVMYEIDEVPADEIATILGIPFNTVHSRLRLARKQFQETLARFDARDGHRGGR
jgi:RNA polymerase sigma-70 factor (ECF subfamily)